MENSSSFKPQGFLRGDFAGMNATPLFLPKSGYFRLSKRSPDFRIFLVPGLPAAAPWPILGFVPGYSSGGCVRF